MSELSDALMRLRKRGKMSICEASVISVNKNKKLVDVKTLVGKADVPEVRLKAAINENQNYQVLYPKKKSIVWIAFADNTNEAVIIAYSEIDSIECKCDDIKFNDGLNKGLVNILPLKAELARIEANLNLIKPALAIALGFASATVDSGSSISAYSAALPLLPPQNLVQLEDTKIQH